MYSTCNKFFLFCSLLIFIIMAEPRITWTTELQLILLLSFFQHKNGVFVFVSIKWWSAVCNSIEIICWKFIWLWCSKFNLKIFLSKWEWTRKGRWWSVLFYNSDEKKERMPISLIHNLALHSVISKMELSMNENFWGHYLLSCVLNENQQNLWKTLKVSYRSLFVVPSKIF